MARENKTKYAMLGLLSYGPMSGYDIKKAVEQGLRFFWNESYGQIYPTMKQLAEEGLATSAVERTSGKPDRRVYSITEAGRAELWRWLDKPAEPMRERVEVLLKLFFGCAAPIETSVAHLERTRAEHAALLLEYEGMETHIRAEHGDHPAVGFGLLALRCGIHHSAAYVAWCDEALATLAESTPNPKSKIENPKSKEPR